MAVSDREFAALEAEVRHHREAMLRMEDAMRELADRISKLDATLQNVRGGWVAIAGVGAVLIAIGTAMMGLMKLLGYGR